MSALNSKELTAILAAIIHAGALSGAQSKHEVKVLDSIQEADDIIEAIEERMRRWIAAAIDGGGCEKG